MNCFSACRIRICRFVLLLALVMLGACDVSDSANRDNEREYNVHFTISPDPATSTVRVELRVRFRRSKRLPMSVVTVSYRRTPASCAGCPRRLAARYPGESLSITSVTVKVTTHTWAESGAYFASRT